MPSNVKIKMITLRLSCIWNFHLCGFSEVLYQGLEVACLIVTRRRVCVLCIWRGDVIIALQGAELKYSGMRGQGLSAAFIAWSDGMHIVLYSVLFNATLCNLQKGTDTWEMRRKGHSILPQFGLCYFAL